MIQRIQSVWLLLAAICAALTFKYSFYSGNKTGESNMPEFQKLVASSNFLLVILTAILTAGCFILIFLYKNRKQQLWLSVAATILSLINLLIYFTEIKKFDRGTFSLSAVFALIIPVLLILSARGIWKDEKLIKSLDRLR